MSIDDRTAAIKADVFELADTIVNFGGYADDHDEVAKRVEWRNSISERIQAFVDGIQEKTALSNLFTPGRFVPELDDDDFGELVQIVLENAAHRDAPTRKAKVTTVMANTFDADAGDVTLFVFDEGMTDVEIVAHILDFFLYPDEEINPDDPWESLNARIGDIAWWNRDDREVKVRW